MLSQNGSTLELYFYQSRFLHTNDLSKRTRLLKAVFQELDISNLERTLVGKYILYSKINWWWTYLQVGYSSFSLLVYSRRETTTNSRESNPKI